MTHATVLPQAILISRTWSALQIEQLRSMNLLMTSISILVYPIYI